MGDKALRPLDDSYNFHVKSVGSPLELNAAA